jgi:hypothetical protein
MLAVVLCAGALVLVPEVARAEDGTIPAPCPAALELPIDLPAVASGTEVTPGTVLAGIDSGAVFAGATAGQVWWVKNSVVSDDHGQKYRVRTADVGSTLAQVALFHELACRLPVGTSPAVTVKADTVVSASAKNPARGKGAVVRVKVKTPGLDGPAGKVTVTWGKKAGKTATAVLAPDDAGTVKVTLPVLPKGKVTIKTRFEDFTGKALDATAETITLTSRG